jgi:MYXO-CTERM domain-containing protein
MRSFVVLVVLTRVASATPAAPMAVEGYVTDAHARWTQDASRIITEATVRTAAGDVVVSQLGGTIDGLTMRTFPGPRILEPGMQVAVGAHRDVDMEAREYVVVDQVKVIADVASFVRTGPTKAGHSLFWESGCVFVTVDAAGTKEVPNDQEFPIIDKAIATWNDSNATCSYLKIMQEARAFHEVGKDAVNMIKMRDDSWCRPKIKDDPARCYEQSAAGLTTATFVDDSSSDRDGAIVDADIELNGHDFSISVDGMTLGSNPCKADLQATLTHELGHLQGLEHTCRLPGNPARVDDKGNPVPLCSDTNDPAIREATMFPLQDCGETKKATLEDDDRAATCSIYPKADDPGTCEHVSLQAAGCCSTGGDPRGSALVGALTALVLLRRRRRR